ncbi:MAG: DegQ family serine endoprotease [Desulfobacterales bacterium]
MNGIWTVLCRKHFILFVLMCVFAAFSAGYPVEEVCAKAWNAPESFSEIAKDVMPSVVNIRTEKTVKGGGRVFRQFGKGPMGEDPFDFFEKFFGGDPQRDFKQRSLGSGFIIDPAGYIVTNNHVIEGADEIQVRLNDEKEYDAEIVGRDPNTDIALIRVKADAKLPACRLGNSDELETGQWVVAIGNPFGLEHTVTAGIVSAKGRVIGSGPYDDFIQTDASINPGNSGGPLINMKGEVIGINTAIIASGQGIGFAVSINLAKGIIDQLKKSGEVTRGWLGVAIQDISPEIAEYYGVDRKDGVLVTEVFKDDPADKAGILAKDIIVAVNGTPVKTTRDLTRMIADIAVGQKAEIDVLRAGKEKHFSVTVAKREDERLTAGKTEGEKKDDLGIQVSQLNPEMAARYNIPQNDGVIVTGVESGSKGDAAGIMSGDIIREINHQPIQTAADYQKMLDSVKPGEAMHFFIRRMNSGFVVIKLVR